MLHSAIYIFTQKSNIKSKFFYRFLALKFEFLCEYDQNGNLKAAFFEVLKSDGRYKILYSRNPPPEAAPWFPGSVTTTRVISWAGSLPAAGEAAVGDPGGSAEIRALGYWSPRIPSCRRGLAAAVFAAQNLDAIRQPLFQGFAPWLTLPLASSMAPQGLSHSPGLGCFHSSQFP